MSILQEFARSYSLLGLDKNSLQDWILGFELDLKSTGGEFYNNKMTFYLNNNILINISESNSLNEKNHYFVASPKIATPQTQAQQQITAPKIPKFHRCKLM